MFIGDTMKPSAAVHLKTDGNGGKDVGRMAKEAALTGRAGCAISFPNEIRVCHSTGTGGQLSPTPARSFHIFEFAGSMKQEQLSSVWCRRTEAITNRINITESQNSGLANVTEPRGKVKKMEWWLSGLNINTMSFAL